MNETEVRPRTATNRDALIVYDEGDFNENAAENTQYSLAEITDILATRLSTHETI